MRIIIISYMQRFEPPTPRSTEPPRKTADIPRVRSRELLGAHREVLIEHGSDCYRLRETRNGKLILTK